MEKKKIAIWGCGNLGYKIKNELGEKCNLRFWVDNAPKADTLDGVPIIKPEKIKDILYDIDGIIIGIVDIFEQRRNVSKLLDYNGLRIGVFRDDVDIKKDLRWEDVKWIDVADKAIFPYMECNIIDRCNLMCSGCTHFANMFDNNDKGYDIGLFENDVKRLSECTDIVRFRLLGGEPLLLPNICDYVRVSKKWLPNTDVHIVTNGTLIPNMNSDFFECLRETDTKLYISLYGPTQKRKDIISDILDNECIRHTFTWEIDEFRRFLNLSGNSDPQIAFSRCLHRMCLFLREGRLYSCPTEGMIFKFAERYPNETRGIDYKSYGHDIYDESIDWKKLAEEICNPIPMCRYCDENGGIDFKWHVSPNPIMDEWCV